MAKTHRLLPLGMGRERREARQRTHEETRVDFRVVRHRWLGRVARAVVKWICK